MQVEKFIQICQWSMMQHMYDNISFDLFSKQISFSKCFFKRGHSNQWTFDNNMEILKVIQFLMEHGADPNVRAYIGLTLLLIARRQI